MREFMEYRDRKKQEYAEQEDQRRELRKGKKSQLGNIELRFSSGALVSSHKEKCRQDRWRWTSDRHTVLNELFISGFEDLQEEVDDFEEESVEFFIKEEQTIVE